MSNTASQIELREQITLASMRNLSIQIDSGDRWADQSTNYALFRLIEERKRLAHDLKSGRLNSTEDAYLLFQKYNEDIRKIIGL